MAGLNNNPKQVQQPTPQELQHQYSIARGGAMNSRTGSTSVPNLDNTVPNTNVTSPPPPNYKAATQHPTTAQQHLSNHHQQQHHQQYAGKEVHPNGQSLSNPTLDKNAVHLNNASHQYTHHQLLYDQQTLANHHMHNHHLHERNHLHNMTDLTSTSAAQNGRVGSTRPNCPPPNYNQLPYHGSQYVSGWVQSRPQQQHHMVNYGVHPQQRTQPPQVPDHQHQYYYQKGGNGYGHQVHPFHHHHSHQYAQQGPPNHIPYYHQGQENSTGLLNQRHQSRSVPSVHDAVTGQSNGATQPHGEAHSSRNSLHETTRLNRSSTSLRGSSMHDDLSSHGMDHLQHYPHQHRHPGGSYQQQQPFSTFIGAPYNQQIQQAPPCMANARCQSKKQNQRGIFMRQQSAPDVPPEHGLDNETDVYSEGFNNPSEGRSRSQGNLRRPPMAKMHSIDDVGYKSEGSYSKYKRNGSGSQDELLGYDNQALPPDSVPLHQCIGTTNPTYRRSGGDLTMIPPQQQRPHSSFQGNSEAPRNNGYLSDGEGYAIRNRRISKSGRYGGSHGSSPGANGPTVPFGYDSHTETSKKSPHQQHVGLRQRHDSRSLERKNLDYNNYSNDRSGDETRDDDDDDEEEEEEDDGYIGDNIDERDHNRLNPRHPSGSKHVVANISTTPADTDDLDDIEDDADDDEENDDDIEDERDMEDTNEEGTTVSGTATVVAASVTTAAAIKTKSSNGTQNATDLIVSYSTYQSQTSAIGNRNLMVTENTIGNTNASKIGRVKVKQNKSVNITNNQGNNVQIKNSVTGADSSCEEIFASTVDSANVGSKNKTKNIRSNNSSGCSINDEGKSIVPKKSGRGSGGNSVKNSRNNSRQGIYSSDQSSTGADQAPLPPPPDPSIAGAQSSVSVRRRRGQMERADSQHSSSGGGGYRSEPGNCTSCGSGGKEM